MSAWVMVFLAAGAAVATFGIGLLRTGVLDTTGAGLAAASFEVGAGFLRAMTNSFLFQTLRCAEAARLPFQPNTSRAIHARDINRRPDYHIDRQRSSRSGNDLPRNLAP